MKEPNKKIPAVVAILFLLISFSPFFARKTEAQWIDISTAAKDYGLDALAYQIINMTIEKMAASTVNWINTGFKGSPAFVTNPEAFFMDVGDKAAGDYIFRNKKLNASFLCSSNLGVKVKIALSKSYLNERPYQCTLTQIGRNFDDFMNNFENGGWDNFFELTQKPQNNPLGMYIQAEVELNQELAKKLKLKEDDLNWGKGFMSFKQCDLQLTDATQGPVLNPDGTLKPFDPNADYIGEGGCAPGHERTVTPGSVINEKLNGVLGTGDNRIAAADEINELISALLNQLTSRVIGGIGSGLRGLSKPDSANNNQSFASQLSSFEKDNKIDDYYELSSTTVDTFLNQPPVAPIPCSTDPALIPIPGCVPPEPPAATDETAGDTTNP